MEDIDPLTGLPRRRPVLAGGSIGDGQNSFAPPPKVITAPIAAGDVPHSLSPYGMPVGAPVYSAAPLSLGEAELVYNAGYLVGASRLDGGPMSLGEKGLINAARGTPTGGFSGGGKPGGFSGPSGGGRPEDLAVKKYVKTK